MTNRTIFALATAPAKSGVAVIRISGVKAASALALLISAPCPVPNFAKYSAIYHPISGEVIDKGLVLYFQAPHSFTGEDVVELQVHGSPAVIREILEVLATIEGLRSAEAGEFTRRAFINGKMDLLEAEGLADLINAETYAQKTQAMRQMQGEMSGFYEQIRSKTIHCLALLEAYIDFPDEEIPEEVLSEWRQTIIDLRTAIRSACADRGRGERLRDGLSIVIIGAPNAGKSSLLNVLAQREAAIVSHHAGTTRDVIEVQMDIAGYPVLLMDTAGLREASDEVEGEGIRRAKARAGQADIKLALFDASKLSEIDEQTMEMVDSSTIVIFSKYDLLLENFYVKEQRDKLANPLYLSITTGQGIEQLFSILEERVIEFFSGGNAPFITRSRHRSLLQEAEMLLGFALEDKELELSCE
jgi:tRNA modification GTPase